MALGIVNIGKDARGDMFHRYKMPVLQVKVEGKGNGIKTVIPNMSDIARSLARPPTCKIKSATISHIYMLQEGKLKNRVINFWRVTDTTKFFGCELGAQTTFDEKYDRYIINGAHQADRLRELLDVFIDKFVLCSNCKNPETELLIVGKEELIWRDCKACGHRGVVDNRHKLCTFILKNPPESSKKKSKKDKKANKGTEAGGAAGEGAGSSDEGHNSQDELTKRIEGEAVDEKTAEATSTLKDEDWSADTSAAAVQARMKSLEAGIQNGLALDDDDDENPGGPYGIFSDWILAHRDQASDPEILLKAKELGIEKKHKTVQILAQNLFTANAVKEVSKHHALFAKMVNNSEKHQKALLGGIEQLCGEAYPSLVPLGVPKIIMEFYQADILEEEIIKQWGTHVSKKYVDKDVSKKVRRACEPLLKWLDEAEDEDDEE
ncbi:hypothetical protein PSHT_10073 [Puccinia striiformis]|uniref:Uncharacterized protein n=2 Tax=Puccinia striiformis TaxID=27350 RepID=A0A2S4VC85_9BASI|nr:hypothetical protein PSTT_15276 [Puccinia striiformis]POW07156.1 hypothetical protein PSHT_10073 [Puccinia striiformis]